MRVRLSSGRFLTAVAVLTLLLAASGPAAAVPFDPVSTELANDLDEDIEINIDAPFEIEIPLIEIGGNGPTPVVPGVRKDLC